MLLVPLVENPPWTRRVGSTWQKFINQKWEDVSRPPVTLHAWRVLALLSVLVP